MDISTPSTTPSTNVYGVPSLFATLTPGAFGYGSLHTSTEFPRKTSAVNSVFLQKNIISIPLYYDSYENYFGEGFYPQTTKDPPCITEITISFSLDNEKYWRQTIDNNQGICGLDGDNGHLLLAKINELAIQQNIHTGIGIGIKNKYDLVIYPTPSTTSTEFPRKTSAYASVFLQNK